MDNGKACSPYSNGANDICDGHDHEEPSGYDLHV